MPLLFPINVYIATNICWPDEVNWSPGSDATLSGDAGATSVGVRAATAGKSGGLAPDSNLFFQTPLWLEAFRFKVVK